MVKKVIARELSKGDTEIPVQTGKKQSKTPEKRKKAPEKGDDGDDGDSSDNDKGRKEDGKKDQKGNE